MVCCTSERGNDDDQSTNDRNQDHRQRTTDKRPETRDWISTLAYQHIGTSPPRIQIFLQCLYIIFKGLYAFLGDFAGGERVVVFELLADFYIAGVF